MPFINVKTNSPISKDKETVIKAKLGQAITTIPGKSESWLMVGLEPEYTLYFQGTDELCAMVEVSIFGSASAATLDALTGKITEIINSELDIKPARIYVQYSQKPEWGWNGSNL
ncbi:MAG: hypothetical protein IJ035_01070 [Oscillospiraceae bacterium]|nr:hypothetical protein [Oscillospiraceae bacterium]